MTTDQQPTTLRAARLANGISQLQLAIRADCSLNTVSVIERGGRMSDTMAKKLEAALRLPTNTLNVKRTGQK